MLKHALRHGGDVLPARRWPVAEFTAVVSVREVVATLKGMYPPGKTIEGRIIDRADGANGVEDSAFERGVLLGAVGLRGGFEEHGGGIYR